MLQRTKPMAAFARRGGACRRRARRKERPSWLRGCAQTRVGRAGMEASGDCERSWAKRGRVERPRDADVTAAATEVLDRTYRAEPLQSRPPHRLVGTYSGQGEPPQPGPNGEVDFRKTKRSNETHASTTDKDARLYRKGDGQENRLGYHLGHALMENRNGLVVAAEATLATGTAEREAAARMSERLPKGATLSEQSYDAEAFVDFFSSLMTLAPRARSAVRRSPQTEWWMARAPQNDALKVVNEWPMSTTTRVSGSTRTT